ncbi:MAG: nascent polypeptide-associated complex protein [Nanoarchaeota archaeon]
MFGGLDPKKMQAVMKQMGIKQDEIEASRVIIEGVDKKIIIESPSVQKITMQGQVSWQITGEVREEEAGIRDEDIDLVAGQAGVSKEKARAALEKHGGDLAQALASLE